MSETNTKLNCVEEIGEYSIGIYAVTPFNKMKTLKNCIVP